LDSCQYRKTDVGEAYECVGGFANVRDPLGERVCRVYGASWVRLFGSGLSNQGHTGANIDERTCRWKN
jgi:hypothetical protein